MLHTVKVYGSGRCARTLRAMAMLESMGFHFDFFDLEADPHAAAWVRWKNPDAPTPTIMVGMEVLANPGPAELKAVLEKIVLPLRPVAR